MILRIAHASLSRGKPKVKAVSSKLKSSAVRCPIMALERRCVNGMGVDGMRLRLVARAPPWNSADNCPTNSPGTYEEKETEKEGTQT